jgi:hypothetical protein
MKEKKGLGLMALVLAFGVIVMGCPPATGSGDLPVDTIKWVTDSAGYEQFYTNDTENCRKAFYGFISHSGDTYETEVKKMSGNAGFGYGMLFLYGSIDSYYNILISTNGWYIILKTVAGVETTISDWAKSSVIVQGYNKANTLKVVKAGNNFTVYINNTQVHTFTDSAVTGTKIGAYVGVGDTTQESFPNTPVDVRSKVLQ